MYMKMMTKEIEKRIPDLGGTENLGSNASVHVKFFSPWTGWTWYATEYDPIDQRFFGYVCGDSAEYGYFSLDDLTSVDIMEGVPVVARAKHWTWKTPIGEVVSKIEAGEVAP